MKTRKHMDTYPETDKHEKIICHIEELAQLMDSQFKLPGTKIKLGLDSIIGLIPGLGDTASLGISGYILLQSARLKPPKRKLFGMGLNIFLDWVIGLVPIIGDVFDIGWKANNRNAKLMREYHEQQKTNTSLNEMPPT